MNNNNINLKETYKFIHHSLLRGTDTMLHLLQKGADYAKEHGNEAELLSAQLAPDMLNFTKQVQVFTDNVAGGIARGAGIPKPSMPDTETTFADLITRTEKTKEFIKSVNPDTVEGIENIKIKLFWMPEGTHFDANTYLGNFVLQNSLFHLTTAYDILRMKGLQIGKTDYIGTMEFKKD